MRIAQVAPLAESVPPKLYGGTERVIAWLTEELIGLGHDMTLFASGDSATSATLVEAWPRALRLGRPKADPAVAETALLELVGQQAHKFDVIHCHTNWTHLPLLTRLGVPFLTTLASTRRDCRMRSAGFRPRRSFPFRTINAGLQLEGRAADDLEHVSGRGLLLEGLAQLVEQPHVLYCDDCLGCEVLDKLDLLVVEWRSYVGSWG
jgi:glycosyltransferase involved in cell wall biosynthesis